MSTERFQNKYRIQSHRMPNWDYSAAGIYFITIVTQGRVCNMGEIIDGKMVFSDFGTIVEQQWYQSFEIRDELFLDELIIMPNHIHALIILEPSDHEKTIDEMQCDNHNDCPVETHGRASLHATGRASLHTDPNGLNQPVWQRKPKSISSFIAGFKSAVTTRIDDYIDKHKLEIPKFNRNNKFWQSNYYDHIVRNNNEYSRIRQYIKNNPANWDNDKFNDVNN